MRALDIEAVRAFIMTVDLKGFTRAAAALDATQSAISLRIKRLEDVLGRRLLERTPRHVSLSADGEAFLPRARLLLAAHQDAIGSFEAERRRLVVGISHHIVGTELPFLLKSISAAEPSLLLEMRVMTSKEVLAEFDAGAVDAAIVLRHDNRRQDGTLLLHESFGWMAAPDFEHRDGTPLRLATQAEPCSCPEHGNRRPGPSGSTVDGGIRRRWCNHDRRGRLCRPGRCRTRPPCSASRYDRYRPAAAASRLASTRGRDLRERYRRAGEKRITIPRRRDLLDSRLSVIAAAKTGSIDVWRCVTRHALMLISGLGCRNGQIAYDNLASHADCQSDYLGSGLHGGSIASHRSIQNESYD